MALCGALAGPVENPAGGVSDASRQITSGSPVEKLRKGASKPITSLARATLRAGEKAHAPDAGGESHGALRRGGESNGGGALQAALASLCSSLATSVASCSTWR